MKKKTPPRPACKRPSQFGRVRPLREQIAALDIIRALEAHVLGSKKMLPSQVTAALALLRKRMPDLVRRQVNPVKKRKEARRATHEDALKELE